MSRCSSQYLVMLVRYELHHEVGSSALGDGGIEDPGDARVVHEHQGLSSKRRTCRVSMPTLTIFAATGGGRARSARP